MLFMYKTLALVPAMLAMLATAAPPVPSHLGRDVSVGDLHSGEDSLFPRLEGGNETLHFDTNQIHANIMKSWDAFRITTWDKLYTSEFLQQLVGIEAAEDRMVYLSDRRTWVSFPEPVSARWASNPLQARQGGMPNCPPQSFHALNSSKAYWSPWNHITSCDFGNSKSGASASYSVTNGYSLSISLSPGVKNPASFLVKEITQAIGFSVSDTHTISESHTCACKEPWCVVQVWARHYMVFSDFDDYTCQCGHSCTKAKKSWAIAPASSDDTLRTQFGCSNTAAHQVLRCS